MDSSTGFYKYKPNEVLPPVFAAIIGISWVLHMWQNFRYRFWRVTFFMVWGGAVFTCGWLVRIFSVKHPADRTLYIAQTVLIYAGPPIYSAAEYNILARLMYYLPMHAPLHPGRTLIVFIYLGALVESLTAAGAARLAASGSDVSIYRSGGTLISIGIVLQAAIECIFIAMVGLLHYRCARSCMLTRNVRIIYLMLYGTSSLVILRCVFRAVESFGTYSHIPCEEGLCVTVSRHEWLLYAFDTAPMVLYTYWLNLVHPGRFMPRQRNRYLDVNGTERHGPGWIDKRSKWKTFADPLDLGGTIKGQQAHEKFWLQPDNWPALDNSFAGGTATNAMKEPLVKRAGS